MTLSLCVLLAAQGAQTAPPHVVSASLFKNGYAVVTRSVTLGKGEILLTELPQAVLGTFWITASDGVKIQEAVLTEIETDSTQKILNFDQMLRQNIGKTIKIQTKDAGEINGQLVSAEGEILVIKSSAQTFVVNKNQIISIMGGTDLIWEFSTKRKVRGIRIKAQGNENAKIFFVSLERGITWAPSYAMDISHEKNLAFTAKAIVLNDLVDLNGADIRLVTGFPNIPFLNWADPFTSGTSVNDWVNVMMRAGAPADARKEGYMMGQNVAKSAQMFDEAFDPAGTGEQLEDLFFYDIKNVTLQKGERAYYILLSAKPEYEHLYTWDMSDAVWIMREIPPVNETGEVWFSIKMKNSTGQPLTTAPAITLKNNEIIGQGEIAYTSPNAYSIVRVSKALDVQAKVSEEELSRQRERIEGNVVYELIILQGTLEVKNTKQHEIKMKISRTMLGEVLESDPDAKVVKTAQGLRELNPRTQIEWERILKAGEKITMSYKYKVLMRR